MKVNYRRVKCEVTLGEAIKVMWIKFTLLIIRLLRLLKRLISYAKPLIIVVICLIVYLLIIFFIDYDNVYENLSDIIWSSKDAVFSLIFITYFINATTKEQQYRKRMRLRHYIYLDTMYAFEKCTENTIMLISGDKTTIQLHTNKDKEVTCNKLSQQLYLSSSFEIFCNNSSKIVMVLKEIKEICFTLRNSKELFYTSWDTDRGYYNSTYFLTNELIFWVNDVIQKIEYISTISMDDFNKFIGYYQGVVYNMYVLIENLRIPWRIDKAKHISIAKILSKNNKEILNNYKISYLLDDN